MSLGQQHAYYAPTHSHCWHQGVVESDPVLLSYLLYGLAGGTAPRDRDVSRLLRDDQLAWAHLNVDHPDTSA